MTSLARVSRDHSTPLFQTACRLGTETSHGMLNEDTDTDTTSSNGDSEPQSREAALIRKNAFLERVCSIVQIPLLSIH